MSNYAIKLGLGSVQRFIGAARRSRDLWSGSWLIAEVAKAAARFLYEANQLPGTTVTLIFPATVDPKTDLMAGSPFQASNVLLVRARTDDPAVLVNGALTAARRHWANLTEQVLVDLQHRLRGAPVDVDVPLWRAQSVDTLELFGVWLPWPEDAESSPLADLEAFYSARKRTRPFNAPPSGASRDKSSLDARGESVLAVRPGEKFSAHLRYRLGLNRTEQLDTSGWTKRLGIRLGAGRRFTPLLRVALDPWLRAVAAHPVLSDQMNGLREDCRKLARLGLATRVDAAGYGSFPYDGELLLPTRWRSIDTEHGPFPRPVVKKLERFKKHHGDLMETIKTRYPVYRLREPYVAILCADGDRLGELQCKLPLVQLQALSTFLSGFSAQAREIMNGHQGDCIYAGGDELLALAPLDQLWPCLETLRAAFINGLALLSFQEGDVDYSIGVAIVHAFERDALFLARKSLALAKNVATANPAHRRKALGIVYQPRNGAAVSTRLRWETAGSQPTVHLANWQAAFRENNLPKRTPETLRQLLENHSWIFTQINDATRKLLVSEIRRSLDRRRPASPTTNGDIAPLEQLAALLANHIRGCAVSDLQETLTQWVCALRIARGLAEAYP